MQTFQAFITAVRLGAEEDRRAAERTAQAVLTTFLERLSGGEADDLVQQLRPPDGFVSGPVVLRNRGADRFGLDEFLQRVAQRERADEKAARDHSFVVLHALRLVVPTKEVRDALDQLPGEFGELLSAPGRHWRPVTTGGEHLAQLVADREGLPLDEARRVTEAVLDVLAERLPDREVDALTRQLPDDLRPALERGRAHRTAPRKLDVDDFLEVLGEHLRTDPQQAGQHARVALPALVEVIDDLLLADLLRELPDDYADLIAPERSSTGRR